MGKLTEMDLVEQVGRNRKALEMHLSANFYPRHPSHVEVSTLKGFDLYWKGEIGIVALADYCYLNDHYGLYKYYESFLDDEDLEFDNDEDLL
jgi:hypothetical protein